MNSSSTNAFRRPGAFSSRPPSSPGLFQGQTGEPSEDDDSSSSQATRPQSREQSSPRPQAYNNNTRSPIYPSSTASNSTTSVNNFSRPAYPRQYSDQQQRQSRLSGGEIKASSTHRRQHSQGFFEPSLPSANTAISDKDVMANLTASQIAAQAAMHHGNHGRQRSITIPSPRHSPPGTITGKRKPPPIQTAHSEVNAGRRPSGPQTPGGRSHYNGQLGGNMAAAATAASAAYPKLSPSLSTIEMPPPPVEKEHKLKSERSKMKLFSKPKEKKEADKEKPLPSPNKIGAGGALGKLVSPSMTSLADSMTSGPSSIYSLNNNASTSTLVPAGRERGDEKERAHKHHFLSRQKNKLKDRIADDHALPLSSASSNSRPLDPSAPSPLYNFQPAPASPATTSFTGLDLRHAGRAVREKRKEEKTLPFAPKITDIDHLNLGNNGRATPAPSLFGAASSHTDFPTGNALQGFGLNNMRPEDVWDFLRAKLLVIFEGEELRIPVEDLNRLVTIHIQRCIRLRNPTAVIEDLRSLLSTGFSSLDQTLRGILDQRIVPHLVDLWLFVFGTTLPYLQSVFLPLDLEFKGHGSLLSPAEAAEFWGAKPPSPTRPSADPSSSSTSTATNTAPPEDVAFGNEFDVRRIILLSYRDNIILPRYDALKTTFSRLSLDSINASHSPVSEAFDALTGRSPTNTHDSNRPGTSGSLDPVNASYNSQSSTLYDASNPSRSRGNSNLSNLSAASNEPAPPLPSFTPTSTFPPASASTSTFASRPPAIRSVTATTQATITGPAVPDSAQVTETVGRMLQCVSVLASTQSGDEAQRKMEDLGRSLKLNWLGRGRVGRNRRGFVGGKMGSRGGIDTGDGEGRRAAESRL